MFIVVSVGDVMYLFIMTSISPQANAALIGRSDLQFLYKPLWNLPHNISRYRDLLAVDCYHLSVEGQRLFSTQLWNSLFSTLTPPTVNLTGNMNRVCVDERASIVASQCRDSNSDVNGDGVVNLLDIVQLLDLWGTCGGVQLASCLDADSNCDGVINAVEIATLLTVVCKMIVCDMNK
jgi:hypothetical protein